VGVAILYNGTWRSVLYVGVIALIGDELRLLLYDRGVPLPLATFLVALAAFPLMAPRTPAKSIRSL
jgi:hypothetical protein